MTYRNVLTSLLASSKRCAIKKIITTATAIIIISIFTDTFSSSSGSKCNP
jgi:hypothetical protein